MAKFKNITSAAKSENHPQTRPFTALIFLFGANIISGFAQGITMLAIPWYLVHTMGDGNGKLLNASMISTITLLSLFWGIYAGTLVDRYNRKHIFMSLTAIDALILLSMAGLGYYLGGVSFPMMALVYCATVFTYNVHYPNLYAFVQELFDPQYYAKVNSALEIQGQTTNFIGMMAGGILIEGAESITWLPESWRFEAWELQKIFLMDGSTYVLAFILLSLIPYIPSTSKKVDKGKVSLRIKQGFQYLWKNPSLFMFGFNSHLMFFALLVLIQVMMPIYVDDFLKADAIVLASFKGLYAIGAITAGLLGLTIIVKRGHAIKQIIFLLLLGSLLFFLCTQTRTIPLALGFALLMGISNAGIRILRVTYLVRIVPNHVIGRVNSFFNVLNVLVRFSFILLLTIPFFSDADNGENIIYAFWILSIVLLIAAVTLAIKFRSFDQEAARNM